MRQRQRERSQLIDRERHRLRKHSVSDQNTDTCYYVGEMNELCQSLRFPNEKSNCCHNGKVLYYLY